MRACVSGRGKKSNLLQRRDLPEEPDDSDGPEHPDLRPAPDRGQAAPGAATGQRALVKRIWSNGSNGSGQTDRGQAAPGAVRGDRPKSSRRPRNKASDAPVKLQIQRSKDPLVKLGTEDAWVKGAAGQTAPAERSKEPLVKRRRPEKHRW